MTAYLDHAATSLPRCAAALEAARAAAELGNPGRGLHDVQARAHALIDDARAAVGELLGAGVTCFTSGATASLSQAILGLRPRPRSIAIDPLAHNAVRRAALRLGVPIWILPHDRAGRVDLLRVAREWRDVDLVAVTHASNVSGLLQPVAELTEIAHKRGARLLVDAAQTIGVRSLTDLTACDLLAFSAHKGLAGLPGVGVLSVRGEVELDPLVVGGTGFDAARDDMPDELPARLEAGTPNLPGIAALASAARERKADHWDAIEAGGMLREVIRSSGARLVGVGELPVASFTMEGVAANELEMILDRSFNVTVRGGLHCAPLAHQTLGTSPAGAVRASMGSATTAAELACLGDALRALVAEVRTR